MSREPEARPSAQPRLEGFLLDPFLVALNPGVEFSSGCGAGELQQHGGPLELCGGRTGRRAMQRCQGAGSRPERRREVRCCSQRTPFPQADSQ